MSHPREMQEAFAAIDALKAEDAERQSKREETHGWLGSDDLHSLADKDGLSLPGGIDVEIVGPGWGHIFGSVVETNGRRTKESCRLPWEPREKI